MLYPKMSDANVINKAGFYTDIYCRGTWYDSKGEED